ncbi:MAG TPA: FlgD immunoglobulin-like domain containing protein [bacterium]
MKSALSTVFLFTALTAGPAVPQTNSRLQPFGLDGKVVTSLGVFASLYAGTEGDGVFYRHLDDADTGWVYLGLQGRKIRSIYPHKFGPVGFATTAGIELEPGKADSALVYCSVFNQPEWAVTDSGITRGEVTTVRSLDGFPDPTVCGETFAGVIGDGGQIWRRGFTSTHWEKVLDIGVGVVNVVRADERSGQVWAGGETSIFAPWIARSVDKGENWEISYPDLSGDNACNSIAIHPDDPDVVYAGMEGAVIKTTDGGSTWNYTGLRDTPAYIYGLAFDAATPDHIFAGGLVANPNSWALWESFDGGETWHEISPPVLVTPVVVAGISSIAPDPGRAGVIYVATFGHGLWKYESTPTGVEDSDDPALPERFVLEQNYPNPFNAGTVISFEIPTALAHMNVHLAIYNLRGELVRELINRKLAAGDHQTRWDGRNQAGRELASGIYLYRLQVGKMSAMRKLSLVK